MVISRRAARGVRSLLPLAALCSLPSIGLAQSSGDGFLFKRPLATLAVRGGYEFANTQGEPFGILKRETTVDSRSFDAFNAGVDLNVATTRFVDLQVSLDMTSRSKSAEYREWEENGKPIVQQSTLDRFGMSAGLKYNFVDRGRQISALAYIPARTIPYLGLNAGVLWYTFQTEGDFVESSDGQTSSIYTDHLRAGYHNFMGQAYAGVERRINARFSMISEARYTQATARLDEDFVGLGNGSIQLSGLALNFGAAVRF